jgi:hypothetical protein
MKTMLSLFLLLNSTFSFADNEFQLFCGGNRGKVSIFFEQVKNKIRFTYTNTEGQKDFPIYEGVVTPQTLPFIKLAQKELSKIDTKLVIEWNIEQCKQPTDDPMIFACDGEAQIVFPENIKIKSFDVFTGHLKEQTPTFTYEMIKLRLGLDSENLHYLVGMPFDPSQCFVKNNFLKNN